MKYGLLVTEHKNIDIETHFKKKCQRMQEQWEIVARKNRTRHATGFEQSFVLYHQGKKKPR